jgi:Glycosyl transferase family 2
VIGRLRRRAAGILDRRVAPLARRIEDQQRPLDLLVQVLHRVEQRLDRIEAELGELRRMGERVDHEVWPLLRALAMDDAADRRRLAAVRASAGYEEAFTAPEPLVTVTIVTRERVPVLVERALPSVLAQTYQRLEVIVVGDMAGPEVGEAITRLGDPRVRYVDVGYRVVHRDPARRWLAQATLPRNEGYRQASGAWTVDFDDDDALRPDAVERLLALARLQSAEVAYGDLDQHAPDGTVSRLTSAPPQRDRFSLAAALAHAGLRVFDRTLLAAELGIPGDWLRAERMLRAGVRFAHLPGAVMDYYPSRLWGTRAGGQPQWRP